MIQCRRCAISNGGIKHQRVAHFHNDLFDGWFCAPCVDELVDSALLGLVPREAPS